MNTTTARRYNHKCKCGAKFSIFASEVPVLGPVFRGYVDTRTELSTETANFPIYCGGAAFRCKCGLVRIARPVLGRVRPEKKCDGRCTHATGHDCECACGGKNHGKAFE